MWFVWVAVAVAQVQGLDLPDVVGMARNPAAWPMLRQPQLLPKANQVESMSPEETYNRKAYYVEVFVLILSATLLLGTLIMFCGPWVKACICTKSGYVHLEVSESRGAQGHGQVLGISTQKRLLAVAFGATLAACTLACAYSAQTDRLSRRTGLDFELYALLLTGGGVGLLIQALFAVGFLPEGEEFGLSAFVEAAVPALAPIISDGFDTLKDTIFAALCWQSQHMVLQALGVASWYYLLRIHVYFANQENTLAELVSCYLPVLTALPKTKPAGREDDINEQSCLQRKWNMIWNTCLLPVLYKQVTPTKRELLLIENVPQALLSIVFLYFEEWSTFVAVINVGVPCGQIVATFAFFRYFRACIAPQFTKKLVRFLQNEDYLKGIALFKEAFAEDLQLLKEALPYLAKVPMVGDFMQKLELQVPDVGRSDTMLKFFCRCMIGMMENDGKLDLNKAFAADLQLLKDALPSLADVATIKGFMQHLELQVDEVGRSEQMLSFFCRCLQGIIDNKGKLDLNKAAKDLAAEVAADEAAAAKRKDMFDAAGEGDLPAVRGFQRRDPRAVTAKNQFGSTPVTHAVGSGHTAVAEFLLAHGADADTMRTDGDTLLHYAARWCDVDLVKVLVKAGARTDIKNRNGKTALDCAILRSRNGGAEVMSLLTAGA